MKNVSNPAIDRASASLSEQDRAALYRLAAVRHYRKAENILAGKDRSDSFFEVVEGTLRVFGVTDLPFGTPLHFSKGDVISPIAPKAGVAFWIQALEPTTIAEITPRVLESMPERLHIWIYKNALRSYDQSTRSLRAANRDLDRKNKLLSLRWEYESATIRDITLAPILQSFLRGLPKLPVFATDLAMKIMDENACVQGVADSIKQDPALAGLVLKHVNSALYNFDRQIESFSHACVIMGLNNIYSLLIQEGMGQSLRKTSDAAELHAHSCLISCLCYEISRISAGVQPQIATTIGLMHDVGRTVVTLFIEKNPDFASFAPALDTAKLGADLVHSWGLPKKISDAIQYQNHPEFAAPDAIEHAYQKEVAVLHLAHAFEGIMTGNPREAVHVPFINECAEVLQMGNGSAIDIFQTRILPNLVKTRSKLPQEIRQFIPESLT
jgi:HD-like signal output (HDOD) protein